MVSFLCSYNFFHSQSMTNIFTLLHIIFPYMSCYQFHMIFCFLYIEINMNNFRIHFHSFYIHDIHHDWLYYISKLDCLGKYSNHSIRHKRIRIFLKNPSLVIGRLYGKKWCNSIIYKKLCYCWSFISGICNKCFYSNIFNFII